MGLKHNIAPYRVDNIYQGDCAELLKKLPENCIDMTVTSPPYDNLRDYRGYTFDFETIAKELFRVTVEGGVVVWIVADATINGSETGTSFRQAIRFMEIGFMLHDTMIYCKRSTQSPQSTRYWNVFEYMFVFSKGRIIKFNPLCDRVNISYGQKLSGADRERDGSKRKKSNCGQPIKKMGCDLMSGNIQQVLGTQPLTNTYMITLPYFLKR